MNRRGFITALGFAPVAGVMAARDAMAARTYATGGWISGSHGLVGSGLSISDELHVAQSHWGEARLALRGFIGACCGRDADDCESVSAQFAGDLAFLQADAEVVS